MYVYIYIYIYMHNYICEMTSPEARLPLRPKKLYFIGMSGNLGPAQQSMAWRGVAWHDMAGWLAEKSTM